MMQTGNKDEKKTPAVAQEDDDDLQLPLVHAVRSEYYITPLNNQFSLIPEIQKLEHDLKKSSEHVKKQTNK